MRFPRYPAWASALSIAFTAAGCSDERSGADGTVFRDSAGIAIAESDHTKPAWGTGAWRLSETPILEVGSLDAEGPEQFMGVTDAKLLPNGDLAVVNSRLQHVVVFDDQGRHRRTMGRNGDGPGEFRSPRQVYALPGDSLAVVDTYRAVSVFDSAGGYVRRFVPGEIVGETQGWPIGLFGDGSLFLTQYQHEDEQGRVGLARVQVEPVRVTLDGAIAHRYGKYDEQTVNYGAGVPYLFGPWAQFAPDDEGFWYGPADRYELRRVDREGRVTRLVRLDLPARPVTPADIDGFRARMLEGVRGTPREAAVAAVYGRAQAAESFPAYGDLLVDDAGQLWVQDYPTADRRGPQTWRVFDSEGRYLGTVGMPAGFTPYQVAGGKVVGRYTDESDVEFVRVYGVVR